MHRLQVFFYAFCYLLEYIIIIEPLFKNEYEIPLKILFYILVKFLKLHLFLENDTTRKEKLKTSTHFILFCMLIKS